MKKAAVREDGDAPATIVNINKYKHLQHERYLRVPSKWFTMASKKVFCGARRPFITGILY